MVAAGYSPSVRLFEASACASPMVSDAWPGLQEFFTPDEEIVLASTADEVVRVLTGMSQADARRMGEAAQARTLAKHTAAKRAEEFERIVEKVVAAVGPVAV